MPTTPPRGAEDAPKSAQDFLKPMFAGQVITVYPADDDAALYLFHLIVQKYGWDWVDNYMATKPNFIQGHLPVARSLASVAGRRDPGIHAHRRHLQGRTASQCGKALSHMVSRQGAAEPRRLVLLASRCAAAPRLPAAHVLQ